MNRKYTGPEKKYAPELDCTPLFTAETQVNRKMQRSVAREEWARRECEEMNRTYREAAELVKEIFTQKITF